MELLDRKGGDGWLHVSCQYLDY